MTSKKLRKDTKGIFEKYKQVAYKRKVSTLILKMLFSSFSFDHHILKHTT